MDIAAFTQNYLLYLVMPIWVLVGLLDWYCHRVTRIETTSGVKETILHLMMLGEVGVAVLLGLFFEINALILLLMFAAFVAHEITSVWDLAYTAPRREIAPWEQHVHDYLAVIPFLALSFVVVLHWPQVLGLFGAGSEPPSFTLEWKRQPLPVAYVVGLLTVIVLFSVIPYLEELWRGLRAARRVPSGLKPIAR